MMIYKFLLESKSDQQSSLLILERSLVEKIKWTDMMVTEGDTGKMNINWETWAEIGSGWKIFYRKR